jgi:heme exporter protein CcmD
MKHAFYIYGSYAVITLVFAGVIAHSLLTFRRLTKALKS